MVIRENSLARGGERHSVRFLHWIDMRYEQLEIADPLADFIKNDVLPSAHVDAEVFWSGLARMVRELGPRNAALLARRDELQERCLLYTSPSPRDKRQSRMPSSA